MSYYLKITDEAAEMLLANARWYAERAQSIEIATAWYDGFLAKIESLEENPFIGPLAPESEHVDFELREIYYGSGKQLSHRALYRVRGNLIEVLSIRHLSQGPLKPGDL
jgi:plasmid stabilization system protein ParE